MRIICYVVGIVVCGLWVSAQFSNPMADITLLPQDAQKDSGWIIYDHAPESGAFWLHAKETLYQKVTQKMDWTFQGISGNYRLKIKTGTKRNGKPPISVSIDGRVVWKGRQPFYQTEDKLWCCGGSRPKNQCTNAPPAQYQREPPEGKDTAIITTQKIYIKKRAVVTFHGSTVYPCSDFMGKEPRPGQGGGAYPILYYINARLYQ